MENEAIIETEDLVKEDLGVPKVSVAAIGPAGENMSAGALIQNDKNHTFAHSGGGAVMGSKNLKAIAVYGEKEVPVHDKEKLSKLSKKWRDAIRDSHIAKIVGGGGVPKQDYRWIGKDAHGIDIGKLQLIAKNCTTSQLPGFGHRMSKQKITPKPCFRCPIGCAYDIEMVEGPHKGFVATPGGGGENLEGAASVVGVSDTGEV